MKQTSSNMQYAAKEIISLSKETDSNHPEIASATTERHNEEREINAESSETGWFTKEIANSDNKITNSIKEITNSVQAIANSPKQIKSSPKEIIYNNTEISNFYQFNKLTKSASFGEGFRVRP